MSSFVVNQMSLGCKSFIAPLYSAEVGFFTSMCANMGFKVAFL